MSLPGDPRSRPNVRGPTRAGQPQPSVGGSACLVRRSRVTAVASWPIKGSTSPLNIRSRGEVPERELDARDALGAASDWSAGPLEDALRGVAERRGLGAGKLFQPLRVALTGSSVSPGIFDVLMLLGRERSLARIDTALQVLTR